MDGREELVGFNYYGVAGLQPILRRATPLHRVQLYIASGTGRTHANIFRGVKKYRTEYEWVEILAA